MWAAIYPETLPQESASISRLTGTQRQSQILRDFYAAAGATDLSIAERRWTNFHRRYILPGGEFEDGTAANLWKWSEQELQRCQALKGGNASQATRAERALRTLSRQIRR